MFAVAGAVWALRAWTPLGDWAAAELVVRHFSRHLPLSGPYSGTRGYNHPLPLVYAIQWLPYHLLGQRSAAGLATTVWWNGSWIAALVWLLNRHKAPWLAVVCTSMFALMAAFGDEAVLLKPWNPSLALIPAVVMIFVGWRVALGSRRLLPVLAGLGVWCSGAHLGFVPLVIVVAGGATLCLLITTVRHDGRAGLSRLVRPLLAAVAVAAILCTPMAVDLLTNGADSNPTHIVERGREPGATPVPPGQAIKVLQAELAIPPAWATARIPYDHLMVEPPGQFPWLGLVGLLAAIAARRRRAHDELVGLGLSLAGLLVATASLANLDAFGLQSWYLYPSDAAAGAFWAFVLWSVGCSLNSAYRAREPATWSTGTARWARSWVPPIACVVASLLVLPSLHLPSYEAGIAKPVSKLAAGLEGQLEPGENLILDGPVEVDGYYTQALALQLDRAGFDIRVPDEDVYNFGPTMRAPRDWRARTLVLTLSDGPAPPPRPGAERLVEVGITNLLFNKVDHASVWELR